MDVCLMIEGQEDVIWADRLALASTCETYGWRRSFAPTITSRWTTDGSAASSTLGDDHGAEPDHRKAAPGRMVAAGDFPPPGDPRESGHHPNHVSGGRVELGMRRLVGGRA
jgi:hypothetical protein